MTFVGLELFNRGNREGERGTRDEGTVRGTLLKRVKGDRVKDLHLLRIHTWERICVCVCVCVCVCRFSRGGSQRNFLMVPDVEIRV